MKAICGARAVLPGRVVKDAVILYENGKIVDVGEKLPIPEGAEVIDAKGAYVGPGFVDIHVHGSGPDCSRWEEDPAAVAAYHLKHGTTSINAYLGYGHSVEETLEETRFVQGGIDSGAAPSVLGVGYEGPYINPECGAASHANARSGPDPEEYEAILDICHGYLVQWMYAPEMDKDGSFGKWLSEKGIVAAVGHTKASPDEIRKAVDQGARIATHLFDAMGCHLGNESVEITGIIQDTAAVGCLLCPELVYEIIPDSLGMHVKPSNMKLVYQLAGPHRIAIITDSTTRPYDPEDYPEGSMRHILDLNFNEDGELSGSALSMDQAVRNFAKHTGAPVQDLFLMAATTPAKAVRVDDRVGSITAGREANFVFLDDDYNVLKVIFRGEAVE